LIAAATPKRIVARFHSLPFGASPADVVRSMSASHGSMSSSAHPARAKKPMSGRAAVQN
jgi:hypothetical protein